MMNKNNPLLVNGISLAKVGEVPPPGGGPSNEDKKWKRSLEESQVFLKLKIDAMFDEMRMLSSQQKISEYYFKIDYPNAFLAKSFQVSSIYAKSQIDLVGSNTWIDYDGRDGRSDILKGTSEDISALRAAISNPTVQIQKKEIRRMENIKLLFPNISDENEIIEEKSYELVFYAVNSKDELIEKLESLLNISNSMYEKKWHNKNVLYANIKLNREMLIKLSNFNPLRSIYSIENRDYSSLSTNFDTEANDINIKKLEKEDISALPLLGLIDGGVKVDELPFQTVEQLHEASADPSTLFVEHGSAVASVILYGNLSNIEEASPAFRLVSIRALPSDRDLEFNLISLEKLIEDVVPRYPNVKVWNLSIGPQGPIQDEVVSSLTRLLDKIAYEHDTLFVIAAGNTGEEQGIGKRLQIPGDSVNNITVCSYYDMDNKHYPAGYNSIGPGREGGKLKPDIIAHGGQLPINPIFTFSTFNYLKNRVAGTSFAAPQITRQLGFILSKYPSLSVLQARALLEHSVALKIERKREISLYAKGELVEEEIQLLSSSSDEIRIMYSGTISAKGYVILPIPLPEDIVSKKIHFTWTVATKSPVDPDYPDRYTRYAIEDDFYPNAYKYIFRKKGEKKTVVLNLSDEDEKNSSEVLLEEGYKCSTYPSKDNPKYIDEGTRRRELLKWDTLKTQRVSKMTTGISEPFLRLHGLSRTDSRERIEYTTIITINLKDDINIFDKVIEKYPTLQSIQLEEKFRQKI